MGAFGYDPMTVQKVEPVFIHEPDERLRELSELQVHAVLERVFGAAGEGKVMRRLVLIAEAVLAPLYLGVLRYAPWVSAVVEAWLRDAFSGWAGLLGDGDGDDGAGEAAGEAAGDSIVLEPAGEEVGGEGVAPDDPFGGVGRSFPGSEEVTNRGRW